MTRRSPVPADLERAAAAECAAERQMIDKNLGTTAAELRLAAAQGGATIQLTPLHCIRLARRIEAGPPPAPLRITAPPDATTTAQRDWWLRLMACLLLALALIRAADPLARAITGH